MNNPLRLCLVLHNHQPVGNFDGVFEQAYRDSYQPFLDVFEPFQELQISLHISGPLLEWLDDHHPEYLERLAGFVAAGRIEIVGGAFYEPILTMIPSRDRVGQISAYTQWLEAKLGGRVRGMWVAERVWEQSLTQDIAKAGIQYTILDDFHFRNAGLGPDQLHGYFVTEDDGHLLKIFPGSEQLRYLIPFHKPHETITYLREIAQHHPDSVVVFGDDGEKFGTWPETKQHVYDDGWLQEFFEELSKNRDWLNTTTLTDAIEHVPATGKVYLPDASYREMTEWALPVERQVDYEQIQLGFKQDPRWSQLEQFMRGGFWRNFRIKYSEANEMYSRMMMVSQRIQQAADRGIQGDDFERAQRLLYQGQCNCPYWHGAFGGIYLPHLRNGVYHALIAADNLLDKAIGKEGSFVEASSSDFNFDDRPEIRLENDKLNCLVAPSAGGQMYELDVRAICLNALATIQRRPESYHRKVAAGPSNSDSEVASIHDRVVFKQAGLDQRLQYDSYERNSLIDHFYDDDVSLHEVVHQDAEERGDFIQGVFDATIRKNPNRIQVRMVREGKACGFPLRITKGVTTDAGSSILEIAYLLEGLPQDQALHFGVEFNFAGLPAGAEDRYFHRGHERLGHLGTQLELVDVPSLGMTDEWLGLDVEWSADRPTHLWTFPIETVSQSEGGFELVHQSVVVQPHWFVHGDAEGRWSVTMRLSLDTRVAESRLAEQVEQASIG